MIYLKLLHYINGDLQTIHKDISVEDEKKLKKYKFFLDNITNYIYITDRLVFTRESDDYIINLNISENSTCKVYLKSEGHELDIKVKSSSYTQKDNYIEFKYILETDDKEHHIILEIGD